MKSLPLQILMSLIGSFGLLLLKGEPGKHPQANAAPLDQNVIHIVSDNSWRVTNALITDWEKVDFNDSGWEFTVSPAPVNCGWVNCPDDSYSHTMWSQTQYQIIYMRKSFSLYDSSAVISATLRTSCDDFQDVYVNGKKVVSEWLTSGKVIDTDIKANLLTGKNVIAVEADDALGGCRSMCVDATITLGPNTPLLNLPFHHNPNDYGLSLINSFFDHEYPLLGDEPSEVNGTTNVNTTIMKFTSERLSITNNCILGSNCYSGHNGIDFNLARGTPVFPAAAGVVTSGIDSCMGNYVEINHGRYLTVYEHLDTILIHSGHVETSDQIGTVGNTGSSSCTTGTHLHLSVYFDQNNDGVFSYPDELVDPYGWRNGCSQVSTDPWTSTFLDKNNVQHTGATSTWLWAFAPPSCDYKITGNGQTLNSTDGVTVKFPAGSIINTATVAYNIAPDPSGESAPAANPHDVAASQTTIATGHTFQISAIYEDGTSVPTFAVPVNITLTYADSDMTFGDESTLGLYRWDETNSNWIPLTTTLDTSSNQVAADTDEPGIFSLRAQPLNLAPSLSSASPSVINNSQDVNITITGTNFLSTPTLNLGMGSLEVNFVSPSMLTATVPANMAPGTYDLTLRNPDGQIAILPGALKIQASIYLPLVEK